MLIPLKDIPHAAREHEAVARRQYATRARALAAAVYRIELAVCKGPHDDDPPSIGWVLTHDAAQAVISQFTVLPDGSKHFPLICMRTDNGGKVSRLAEGT